MSTRFSSILLLSCLSFTVHASQPVASAEGKPLVFGFLPIVSTQKLLARFGPLTDYLSSKLGRPVRFETAPNYGEFLRRTNHDRRYDILFTAPHFYYLAQRKAGYRAIVRVKLPKMSAIIIAPKAGQVKSVQDLRGRKIAIPDDLSLGAMLIKNHLSRAGLQPGKDVELLITPSHNASLMSVYKGVTDAAGMMIPPFKRARKEVKGHLKIIATTRGTPHMPISVAPHVVSSDRKAIQQILLDMQNSNEGRQLLKKLSWPGFVRTTASEYDQMDWAAKLIR